jgi:hypothetical protein
MIRLAAGWTLAIALALAGVSSARGQGPDIQIAQLECNGDPELVVIENRGGGDQSLDGWQLQSDPPGSEVYDLSVRGELVVGADIRVQSGPSASGVFLQDNWGLEFIFRDDDLTDYVRLVDDTGTVVQQVHCAGEVVAQPSPTPSPEPSPAADVPNGGGAPPPPGDALSAAMMVLVGGSMAAAGMATGALSWLCLRCSPMAGTTATLAPRQAAAHPDAPPRRADGSRGEPVAVALRLALVGLIAAALAFRLLRHRPQ